MDILNKGVKTNSRNPNDQGLETVAFFIECIFTELPGRLAIKRKACLSFAARNIIPALD